MSNSKKPHTRNKPRDYTHASSDWSQILSFWGLVTGFGVRLRLVTYIMISFAYHLIRPTPIGHAFLGIWWSSLDPLFITTREHATGLTSSSNRPWLKIRKIYPQFSLTWLFCLLFATTPILKVMHACAWVLLLLVNHITYYTACKHEW